jgi:hypothetical protein
MSASQLKRYANNRISTQHGNLTRQFAARSSDGLAIPPFAPQDFTFGETMAPAITHLVHRESKIWLISARMQTVPPGSIDAISCDDQNYERLNSAAV